MNHHYKLQNYLGVTRIHTALQRTYYSSQMAACVTSAIQDCKLSCKIVFFSQANLPFGNIPGG